MPPGQRTLGQEGPADIARPCTLIEPRLRRRLQNTNATGPVDRQGQLPTDHSGDFQRLIVAARPQTRRMQRHRNQGVGAWRIHLPHSIGKALTEQSRQIEPAVEFRACHERDDRRLVPKSRKTQIEGQRPALTGGAARTDEHRAVERHPTLSTAVSISRQLRRATGTKVAATTGRESRRPAEHAGGRKHSRDQGANPAPLVNRISGHRLTMHSGPLG